MSAPRFDDFEKDVDAFVDAQEQVPVMSLSTKLERRRRIEALQEEKSLREELDEF